MSLAFRKLSDILRNKEECNELREVAGQQCWIKASYINGNVEKYGVGIIEKIFSFPVCCFIF